jgi:hypothetical protein
VPRLVGGVCLSVRVDRAVERLGLEPGRCGCVVHRIDASKSLVHGRYHLGEVHVLGVLPEISKLPRVKGDRVALEACGRGLEERHCWALFASGRPGRELNRRLRLVLRAGGVECEGRGVSCP